VCRWENVKFLVKLSKSGSEIREILVQIYGDNAVKKTLHQFIKLCVKIVS
jgi:hypothetical protein